MVHPASFGKIDKKTGELKAAEIDKRRSRTLELLRQLPSLGDDLHDASPKAIRDLEDCFTPQQLELPVLAIGDKEYQRVKEELANWRITSAHVPSQSFFPPATSCSTPGVMMIREKLPGRPEVVHVPPRYRRRPSANHNCLAGRTRLTQRRSCSAWQVTSHLLQASHRPQESLTVNSSSGRQVSQGNHRPEGAPRFARCTRRPDFRPQS